MYPCGYGLLVFICPVGDHTAPQKEFFTISLLVYHHMAVNKLIAIPIAVFFTLVLFLLATSNVLNDAISINFEDVVVYAEDNGRDPLQDMKETEDDKIVRMNSLEKIKKFPECNSTRRLEHPGIRSGPRIQYIHNPKAGGTSIQLAAFEWAKKTPGAVFMKYDSNSISGSSTKCPGAAFESTILSGHRGFGYCQSIKGSRRGLFTFTAFRDPVSRIVSWYDYNLYTINEHRALMVFGKDAPPLADLVKKYNSTPAREVGEQLLRYAGQQQARFMCGYEVCKNNIC